MNRARPRTRRGPFLARPRSLLAAGTNVSGRIHLTWLAPAFDGGTAVTDYVIERSPHGANTWASSPMGERRAVVRPSTGSPRSPVTTSACFAVNDAGPGRSSNIATPGPHGVPSAPRSLVAAPTNLSGQIRLTWLAPSSNGGSAVTDYVVQRSPNGTTGWATISDGVNTNTTYTVTGLANGTRYYFRVSPTTPRATARRATSPTPSRAPCRPRPAR